MRVVRIAGAILMTSTGVAHATTETFEDFSNVSTLTLSGNTQQIATPDGWVLRLTSALPAQSGSAFGTATISAASFSSSFAFRLSDPDGTAPDPNGRLGADGITFAIQPVSASLGVYGGGLGIQSVSPSVAVEFDTYKNVDYNDPSSSHIGIDINGDVKSVATVDVTPFLDDGNTWYAWIDCDGSTLTVSVSQTDARPESPQLVYPVNVHDIIGADFAYVGFTAATGGGFQNQDILDWTYLDHYVPPTDADGGTVTNDASAPDDAATPIDAGVIVSDGGEGSVTVTPSPDSGCRCDGARDGGGNGNGNGNGNATMPGTRTLAAGLLLLALVGRRRRRSTERRRG